jgi:hypothetical protein
MDGAGAGRRSGGLCAAAAPCVPFVKSQARHQASDPSLDDVVQDTLLTLHQARHTPTTQVGHLPLGCARSRNGAIISCAGKAASAATRCMLRRPARPFGHKARPSQIDGEERSRSHSGSRGGSLARTSTRSGQISDDQRKLAREAAAATGRKAGALKVSLPAHQSCVSVC